MSQKDIFLKGEGDKWFRRNRDSIKNVNLNKEVNFLKRFLKKGDKILEIGCSNGSKLNYYRKEVGCECYGIDASVAAISDGQKKYPQVNLNVGTTERLDFKDKFFDVVIFGCCLYLVDRDLILKTVAEADRVLKNKGFLGITDFDAKLPIKRPYKHASGVFSYKMDYSKIFLSLPHYVLADKYCYSHSSGLFCDDVSERLASCLLYKDTDAYLFEKDK